MFKVVINSCSFPKAIKSYVKVFTQGDHLYHIGTTQVIKERQRNPSFNKEGSETSFIFHFVRAKDLIFKVYKQRAMISDVLFGEVSVPLQTMILNQPQLLPLQGNFENYGKAYISVTVFSPSTPLPQRVLRLGEGYAINELIGQSSRSVYAYLTFNPVPTTDVARSIGMEFVKVLDKTGEYEWLNYKNQTQSCTIASNTCYYGPTGPTQVAVFDTRAYGPDATYGLAKEGEFSIVPIIINSVYSGIVTVNYVICAQLSNFEQEDKSYNSTADRSSQYAFLGKTDVYVNQFGSFSAPDAFNLKDFSFKNIPNYASQDTATVAHQVAMLFANNNVPIPKIEWSQQNNMSIHKVLNMMGIKEPLSTITLELVREKKLKDLAFDQSDSTIKKFSKIKKITKEVYKSPIEGNIMFTSKYISSIDTLNLSKIPGKCTNFIIKTNNMVYPEDVSNPIMIISANGRQLFRASIPSDNSLSCFFVQENKRWNCYMKLENPKPVAIPPDGSNENAIEYKKA